MRKPPSIAIVGAGPAGLGAAIALRRALDANVTVYERADALRPVGAGVLIQPIGQAVLDEWELGDAVRAQGSRTDRLLGTSHDGRVVIDLAYEKLGDGVFGVGIARRRLHRVLVDAAARLGVSIALGRSIEASDARQLANDFDLVVLADGARSSLREHMGLQARIRPYPWGAVWATVPYPGGSNVLRQYFRAAGEMLGLLPSGDALDGEPSPLVTIFWSLPPGGYERWRDTPIDAWKQRVAALAPEARDWLAPIDTHDAMNRAWYADVRLARPHAGKFVAIGDCAHAMSPQLGQGVNLALVDAFCLAQALRAHASTDAALAAYAKKRSAHVRYYQWASRFLTPLFQSHAQVLPWFRDRFARFGFSAPWMGRQSLYTLAGTKTGILAASRDAKSLLHHHSFPP